MKLTTWKTIALSSVLSLMLTACGGSGSGGSDGGGDGDPAEALCLNEGGTDPDSSTAGWADNCVLSSTGSHANSLYTLGVQRILFCRGFDAGVATVDGFASGEYDATTIAQVEAFQRDQNLTETGTVDQATWLALRDALEFEDITADGFSGHKVVGPTCPEILFFQAHDPAGNDGDGANLGWTQAAPLGTEGQVEFSIAAP